MELKEKLEILKMAGKTLSTSIEQTNMSFIIGINNNSLSDVRTSISKLKTLEEAQDRLNGMIYWTEADIKKEYMKHVKAENCINFIDNGGDCKPRFPGSCKDCECFECNQKH